MILVKRSKGFFSDHRKSRKSQKLKMQILFNEEIKKKIEKLFFHRFRTLRIFWYQQLNSATFEEEEGGEGSACRSLASVPAPMANTNSSIPKAYLSK